VTRAAINRTFLRASISWSILVSAKAYLFTGDHLAGDDDGGQQLHAWKGVCWYSWAEQTSSMAGLLDYRFSWVLPGHGRVLRAGSPAAMREKLAALIERMRGS